MNGNIDVTSGVLTASLEDYPPGVYTVTVAIAVVVMSDGRSVNAAATIFLPEGSGATTPSTPSINGLGRPQNMMQQAGQISTSPANTVKEYTVSTIVTVEVSSSVPSPTVAIIFPTVTGRGCGSAKYDGSITVGGVTRVRSPGLIPQARAGMGGGF